MHGKKNDPEDLPDWFIYFLAVVFVLAFIYTCNVVL